MILCHIAGDTAALGVNFTVLVEPHVLCGEVNFYVSTGEIIFSVSFKIIRVAPGVLLQIDRFPCHMASGFNIFPDLLRLILFKDRIAVVIAGSFDRDLTSERGVKLPFYIARVIFCREFFHKGLDLLVAQLCFSVPDLHEQVADLHEIIFFLLLAESIGEPGSGVLIHSLHLLDKTGVVSVDLRFYAKFPWEFKTSVKAFLRVQCLSDAVPDKILQLLISDLIALDLLFDSQSVRLAVIVKTGILRGVSCHLKGIRPDLLRKHFRVFLRPRVDLALISVKYAAEHVFIVLLF